MRTGRTGVEQLEDVTDALAEWVEGQIEELQKYYGPRPAFTEMMPMEEQVALWKEMEAQGPGAWYGFIQGRMQEGLEPSAAVVEADKFNGRMLRHMGADNANT